MSTPITSTPSAVADQTRWFKEEVHAHDSSLKAYLRGTFPSVRDVDDVVQESYLRVWRRHAARPIDSVRSFLFTVARHLALDRLRHERVSPIDRVTDLDRSAVIVIECATNVRETACRNEETKTLLEAIDALPPRCREIFMLRKLRGLSQKEIAAQCGISEQTVEAQIVRGTHRCGDFLRSRGVTPSSV